MFVGLLDPDPSVMVMDPQHCYKQKFLNVVCKKNPKPVKFGLFGGIGRYFIENFRGSSPHEF
jgi:hypothetical protein